MNDFMHMHNDELEPTLLDLWQDVNRLRGELMPGYNLVIARRRVRREPARMALLARPSHAVFADHVDRVLVFGLNMKQFRHAAKAAQYPDFSPAIFQQLQEAPHDRWDTAPSARVLISFPSFLRYMRTVREHFLGDEAHYGG